MSQWWWTMTLGLYNLIKATVLKSWNRDAWHTKLNGGRKKMEYSQGGAVK
jgi:hypothetical protein